MPAVLVICGLFTAGAVQADERLKGIACRSVHLSYPQGGQVDAFYNEVKVEKSAPGTYFMVCGWQAGYFGIQELANGKKLLIFSVWDRHGGDDPKAVPDDLRVKLIDHDPQVRIGRFGNEGTGGQSFFDYDWKIGETYRFMVSAKVDGNRTQYTGWFYVPESKSWKRLVTFSTITDGHHLSGLYSLSKTSSATDIRRHWSAKQSTATYGRWAWMGSGSKDVKRALQVMRTQSRTLTAVKLQIVSSWRPAERRSTNTSNSAKSRSCLQRSSSANRPTCRSCSQSRRQVR